MVTPSSFDSTERVVPGLSSPGVHGSPSSAWTRDISPSASPIANQVTITRHIEASLALACASHDQPRVAGLLQVEGVPQYFATTWRVRRFLAIGVDLEAVVGDLIEQHNGIRRRVYDCIVVFDTNSHRRALGP